MTTHHINVMAARITTTPITAAEQAKAIAEARAAANERLRNYRQQADAEAIAIDAEVIAEWARRFDDLDARRPAARTERGREIVDRVRIRLGIIRNDLVLAGILPEKK